MQLTQLQVLNYLIDSKDSELITTKGLTNEFFPQMSKQFEYIKNHITTYGCVPDEVTFLKVFPDFERIEVNEPVEYLIGELYKDKNEDTMVNSFNKLKSLLMQGRTEEAVQLVHNTSDNLSGSANYLEAVDILEDISRYDTYEDKCNDFNKYYIPTGFPELDEVIGGWDRYEELAVIAARSGVGKTWWLLKSVTAAVNRGLNVGLFSGEMSVNKVGYRFDTLMSHISNGCLIHGNISVKNKYRDYLETLRDHHKGHLYILTRDMVNGNKCGVSALTGFVEKYNLDILFIDQHSLLDDDRNARQTFDKAANISKDLKILQVTKHIPIIAVSQQNRSAVDESKGAGTENISNSDRIAQDATFILFLTMNEGMLTAKIAKSRDGGSFKSLNYIVDLDKGKYEYIPIEDSEGNRVDTTSEIPTEFEEDGALVF